MSGLIWLVQLVHYPSFNFVKEDNFVAFHRFHNQNISLIVVPVMITELITSGILWWTLGSLSLHGIGFFLVILVWLCTAFLSVPNHAKLTVGRSEKVIRSLVMTNWARTLIWTLKAILSIYILSGLFSL